MDRSWLSSMLPSPTDARHMRSFKGEERVKPRWSASSSARASPSVIPPPIFQSVLLSDDRKSRREPFRTEADSKEQRTRSRQQHLEHDLSRLLDLQELCLKRDAAGAESNTFHPVQYDIVDIRKALYTAIRRLALLKSDELTALRPDLEQCVLTMSRLDDLAARRNRLQMVESDQAERGREDDKVSLREEADRMQDAIVEAEQRVTELKATQRRLRDEALQIERRVQARSDSYARSLEVLDLETTDLLAPYDYESADYPIQGSRTTTGWHATTEKAKLQLARKLSSLQRRHDDVDNDHELLEQSAIVWRDVAKELGKFEATLARDMDVDASATRAEGALDYRSNARQRMHSILGSLDQLVLQLESKHKLAQASGWKVLVCSIEIELDALRNGKLVLQSALDTFQEGDVHPGLEHGELLERDHEHDQKQSHETDVDRDDETDHGQRIRDLDQAFRPAKASPLSGSGTNEIDEDDDDDGPDPNLLISQQESDHDE